VITVNTDRTQAFIGFIGESRRELKNLFVEISNKFACIVVSSLNSKPLALADKMLLTATSRVANTGMKWNDSGTTLAEQGGAPTLIDPVQGQVVLRGIQGATAITVSALDGAGHPLGDPRSARQTADGWTFSVGNPVTVWYVISVNRR
jgi:hypothetical protein